MNSINQQRTLAMMTGFERYTKKTRRAMFLEESALQKYMDDEVV